jgi:hypothetical protein
MVNCPSLSHEKSAAQIGRNPRKFVISVFTSFIFAQLYWYFIPLFVRLRFSRKLFAKNFREKLTKFRENCGTFRKSFRFRERSKKCFRPNPSHSHKGGEFFSVSHTGSEFFSPSHTGINSLVPLIHELNSLVPLIQEINSLVILLFRLNSLASLYRIFRQHQQLRIRTNFRVNFFFL